MRGTGSPLGSRGLESEGRRREVGREEREYHRHLNWRRMPARKLKDSFPYEETFVTPTSLEQCVQCGRSRDSIFSFHWIVDATTFFAGNNKRGSRRRRLLTTLVKHSTDRKGLSQQQRKHSMHVVPQIIKAMHSMIA